MRNRLNLRENEIRPVDAGRVRRENPLKFLRLTDTPRQSATIRTTIHHNAESSAWLDVNTRRSQAANRHRISQPDHLRKCPHWLALCTAKTSSMFDRGNGKQAGFAEVPIGLASGSNSLCAGAL